MPLFLVIVGSIILGILVGTLTGTAKGIKNFATKSTIKKENKTLKKKLGIYETEQSIQDDIALQNRITDKQ